MFPSQNRVAAQIQHLFKVFMQSEGQIRPHFFLTGPSGSGKSFLTKQIAEEFDMPFLDLNAAQITSEGISGNSLSKALRPLRAHWDRRNIIFMDEFDKLFQSNGTETQSYRSDVQNEILHCLEAKNTSVFGEYGKYDQISVENTLFVFAGSFSNQAVNNVQDLLELGMRREFVGRVPLVFSTQQVTLEEMLKALPQTKLFQDYMKYFPLISKSKAIKGISTLLEEQSKTTNLGIRLMASTTHQYFMKDI